MAVWCCGCQSLTNNRTDFVVFDVDGAVRVHVDESDQLVYVVRVLDGGLFRLSLFLLYLLVFYWRFVFHLKVDIMVVFIGLQHPV